MFDAGRAIRNFGEVITPQLFLFFHAEGTVVGGDNLQIISLQPPQLCLILLLAQW